MTTVKLYQFSKEKNSTKQPGTAVASISGLFLSSASIESPAIMFDLNYSNAAEESTYKSYLECNYAYIDDFKRYYFIDNWTFDGRGKWIASMTVDAMATYKTAIGNSTQYIARSASEFNGEILDNSYSTRGFTYERTSVSVWNILPDISYDSTEKKIIVGMTGKSVTYQNNSVSPATIGEDNDTIIGSAKYMAITPQAASNLETGIQTRFDATINALQYIVAYHCLPFEPRFMAGEHSYIDTVVLNGNIISLGGVYGRAVTVTSRDIKSANINISKHPQAATRGNFLNRSEFSRHILYFPPFGSFELDSNIIAGTSVHITVYVDATTGDAMLDVSYSNKKIVQSFGNIAIPLLIDQQGRDTRKIANTITTGAIGVATTAAGGFAVGGAPGALAGAAIGIASNVASMATSDAWLPQNFVHRGGGSLNIASMYGQAEVISMFKNVCDDDNARFGRPLCAARQISTLSGYIQTNTAHVHAATMLPSEQETIETYMNGGFFYE